MTFTVKLDENISLINLNKIIASIEDILSQTTKGDEIIFDFTNCKFLSISGAGYIFATMDYLNYKGYKISALYSQNSIIFQFLNIFGNKFGYTYDNDYIKALTRYTVSINPCKTYKDCLLVQKNIMQKIVNRTHCKEGTFAALDYFLTEIWDNAGVHGYKCYEESEYPLPIYIGAFSHKTYVEVIIIDFGQGIHESLRNKIEYRNLSANETLELSLQNKISGHPKGSPGFGLYISSEFTKNNNGIMHIWSSGRKLELKEETIKTGKGYFSKGTIVVFRINTDVDIDFDKLVPSTNKKEHLELNYI